MDNFNYDLIKYDIYTAQNRHACITALRTILHFSYKANVHREEKLIMHYTCHTSTRD